MFPEIFKRATQHSKTFFRAIYFGSGKSNDQIVELINNMGFDKFLDPDTAGGKYHDARITGEVYYQDHAECCAFTKTRDVFYLFPIHKEELANVGLDEQDLLYWINKLNGMEVGFQYLYFGEKYTPKRTKPGGSYNWFGAYSQRLSTEKFYWVGVPKLGYRNQNKPYLHWVALRYLISTQVSDNNVRLVGKDIPLQNRLAYYHIPRATVMFHEKFGLPFLKAFLYAHLTSPYYCGNSLAYTDYMGVNMGMGRDYRDSAQAPCVNVTEKQFKELWDSAGESLNSMLIQTEFLKNWSYKDSIKKVGLKHLAAPYDHEKLYTLFSKGLYQDFINEIENSYKVYEEKHVTV